MQIHSFDVNEKTGRYEFNNLTLSVKPYWLTPNNTTLNSSNPEEIEMAASAQSAQVAIYSVEEGAIEIKDFACYRTGACLVEIMDDARKQRITGRPCHVDTIFGDGMEPFTLNESLFLRKNEAILMSATDLTAAQGGNDIRPVFHGQRIMAERARDASVDKYIEERAIRSRYVMPFLCPLDEDPAIDADATEDVYFTQQSISHFEVRKLTYSSTGAFKFKIVDESGNQLCNDWIHSSAALGTASEPYVLATPWIIQAGGQVRFTIKDLAGGSGNQIYMTLCGRQLFVSNR